jgi:hypothetical protein
LTIAYTVKKEPTSVLKVVKSWASILDIIAC